MQYLYGVGPAVARDLCVKTQIDSLKKARELDEDELSRLATLLERDYTVEVRFAVKSARTFTA